MIFKKEEHKPMSERKELPRLSLEHRICHFLTFMSVILLVLTAFPIKFHNAPWAISLNHMFGGMEVTRIIHRICGLIFFGTFVFHVIRLVCKLLKFKGDINAFLKSFYMIPDLKDLNDIIGDVKYLFFLSDDIPPKRRFDYAGKMEYLAIYWGCPLVFFTGLLMWFKETLFEINFPILGYLPGWLFNVAKIAHGAEAVLAIIIVVVVHWYIVHWGADVFPARWTWLNGTMPAELLEEEHILEYERLLEEEETGHRVDYTKEGPHGDA